MNPESLRRHPVAVEKCTVGCAVLDGCLGGGVPCNSITEIVAESGSGKTQLSLQLCLYAQLPISLGGLHASSIYLHTEFPFPSRRLHQLSTSFKSKFPQIEETNNYNPCDSIFVRSVHSVDQLFDILLKLESFVVNSNTQLPVRLIVIDSVAALFRSEYENTPGDLMRRSSLFFKISGKLKTLAMRFNMAVVITNQVVDFVGSGGGANGLRIGNLESLYTSGRRVCAALGLAWANCVNSRLFLSKDENVLVDGGGENGLVGGQTKRRLHVVFAPHLPASSCQYRVSGSLEPKVMVLASIVVTYHRGLSKHDWKDLLFGLSGIIKVDSKIFRSFH